MADPKIPEKLLVKRRHTAQLLDVSVDRVRHLEKLGLLDRVRLTPGGDVHHRYRQVVALAEKGGVDA